MDIEKLQLEGQIDAVKLMRITRLAGELGLNVVEVNIESIYPDADANGLVVHTLDTDTIGGTDEVKEQESNPIRRTATLSSFQAYGFKAVVDPQADMFHQRSKKGFVTAIWGKLAEAQFADRTYYSEVYKMKRPDRVGKPIHPENLIGTTLPRYGFIATQKMRHTGMTNNNDKIIEYIEPENCDNMDLDGLAKYLVAVAGHIKEIAGVHSLKGKSAMSKLKTFIPNGISMPGLMLLTDYCTELLKDDEESPVSREKLVEASTTYKRFIEQ
ncbi:hypothetical protein H0V99_00880 [Candidatus Saccharibacteria bacterium]|nr:hypothetical protein [Candidatus Saccharibacteria bacterium]